MKRNPPGCKSSTTADVRLDGLVERDEHLADGQAHGSSDIIDSEGGADDRRDVRARRRKCWTGGASRCFDDRPHTRRTRK